MRAKAVKGIDLKNPESDIWMIMIQKEKGSRYNVGLLDDSGKKPYYTLHKKEAVEKVKKLNEEFSSEKCIAKKYDIIELQNKTKIQLDGIALALDIDISKFKGKQDLIYAILDKQ